MIISVVNMSGISDMDVHRAIRAINRQIGEDFAPYWSLGATLRLEGRSEKTPSKLALPDLRGDAIIYLYDTVDLEDAKGYHDTNARGIPYGFVFTELSGKLNEDWSVTLSHEALELIADPQVNLLVAGPHPSEDRTVFHWYEMSDAVQGETYEIDGIEVSNFVLPLYFTTNAEPGSRNDFIGKVHPGEKIAMPSFGINPGGYIGFFDPQQNKHVTYAIADDARAQERLAVKQALLSAQGAGGRRAFRISSWPREQALLAPPSVAQPLRAALTTAPRIAPSSAINRDQSPLAQGVMQAVERRCNSTFVPIE